MPNPSEHRKPMRYTGTGVESRTPRSEVVTEAVGYALLEPQVSMSDPTDPGSVVGKVVDTDSSTTDPESITALRAILADETQRPRLLDLLGVVSLLNSCIIDSSYRIADEW